MGGGSGGGGRAGRGGGGGGSEVSFNSKTASAEEIVSRMIEQDILRDKIQRGIATEAERARDKELYFQMKGVAENPNWTKAYGTRTSTGLYQKEKRRRGLS